MPADNETSHERKLVTILAADVAGYSRLMADDEVATMQTLTTYREIFSERVTDHKGRVVDTAGDSVLATFDSVVEAVQAAVDIQRDLATANETLAGHRKMHFRIGVNLGDIIVRDDGTVYGDGVNVAARLEALAEPGGVMVADFARQAVKGKLDVGLEDAGEHNVKNIAEPVRAWRVLVDGAEALTAPKIGSASNKLRRPKVIAAFAVGLAVLVGLAVWGITIRFETPRMVMADGTPTDDPALAMPTGPTISVLPFDNLGGDAEQDYFAIGLSEDIVTALSRFGDLRVLEGADASADYALEGSVRRQGNALRVTAQLKDMRDGSQVWSEQFDRDLSADAVFAIQDTITVSLATAIAGYNGAIARQILGEATGGRTDDLAAYECVLLVYVKHDAAFSQETFSEARNCLEEAVVRDSNYVDALAALSYLYGDAYSMGWVRDLEDVDPIDRAFDLATRAVELNPSSTAAHRALALAHFYRHEIGDFAEHADRALSINPHDPQTLGQLGSYLVMAGKYERGAALIHKAYALNPNLPDWYNLSLAMERAIAGDFEVSLALTHKVKDPSNYIVPLMRIIYLAKLDRVDETGPEKERLEELYPGYSIATAREEAVYWNNTGEFLDIQISGLRKTGFPETAPQPSRPIIAVLPFDNMSRDPEQEYFADGITEDIITRMSEFQDLGVIARNSTFQYKGQAVDILTIAEKLGADYVVEGSIRRGGDTVRVTAQLLGGEDGTHLWAETFDRGLDPENLFAVQDEITGAVANRIGGGYGAVSVSEFARTQRQVPDKMSSYECILRVYENVRVLSAESHLAARDCLEAVVEREPNYGVARSYLSDVYNQEIYMGLNLRPDSSLRDGLKMAEDAVRLDPANADTHIFLGHALLLTNDPGRAVREAEEALRLFPNSVGNLGLAAQIFGNTGDYERSKELMDRLAVLNPNHPTWMNWNIAKFHLIRHEYLEAVTWLERTGMDWYFWTNAYIAAALCNQGEIERGQASLELALQNNSDFTEVYWPETHMWFKGDGVYPLMEIVGSGLEACGWDVPPDPGPEAFAPVQ
jgi:adenylate cyclase